MTLRRWISGIIGFPQLTHSYRYVEDLGYHIACASPRFFTSETSSGESKTCRASLGAFAHNTHCTPGGQPWYGAAMMLRPQLPSFPIPPRPDGDNFVDNGTVSADRTHPRPPLWITQVFVHT